MTDQLLDEENIFHVARRIDDKDLRAEYLMQICAGDQALRERVEALLEAHEKEQTFLKSKVVIEPTADISGVTEATGEQIGRYKLLQKIGEGGFGVVYMAEQSRPVRRKVALKVIKPGMDTRAVVARFEAERQALALMDHANIAKVFDGGATESGRPYFVMELVKGVPITEFCDENKFTVRQRLDLFILVCRAIQHAHQKGIIHRDIKPSNVLVTLHDGVPVPKVIDFGVSKAISQQLTEKTLFTAHGQMIGTPQYMSPEQAEMSGLDIDTRSDIYSLGILLYELLTGCTPLEPERIRGTAYVELQRMIREDEPLRPSRRCSTRGEQSVTIAAKRQTDPQKLGPQLRGELDWIVMKTLEKDRNRRYETPAALAKDVENYLNDETVDACPPSMAYRFQKFARRNKTLLMTGGAIAALLLTSTFIVWGMYLDRRDAAIAEQHAKEELKNTLEEKKTLFEENSKLTRQQTIGLALPLEASNQKVKADNIIEDAWNNGAITEEEQQELKTMLEAQWEIGKGNPQRAIELLEDLQSDENDLIVQAMLANAYLSAGDYFTYFGFPVAQGTATPKTPYEYLFVGMAEFWLEYRKSIADLDVAVALTRSPVSFTARANSLSLLACSTRTLYPPESLTLINQAVEDIEIATRLYKLKSTTEGSESPEISSHVLMTHLLILLHADRIYRRLAERMEDDTLLKWAGEVMAEAAKLVDELTQPQRKEDLKRLMYARASLGFYYNQLAHQQKSRGENAVKAESLAEGYLKETIYAPWFTVAELIRLDPQNYESDAKFKKEKERLLDKLDQVKHGAGRKKLMEAYHLLLSKDGDAGRQDVYELIKNMRNRPKLTYAEVLQICQIYRLLGDITACEKFATPYANDKEFTQGLRHKIEGLSYNAGLYGDSKGVEEHYFHDRESTGALTYRFLLVGLSELAQGNRQEAKERFQQIADEGVFRAAEYEVGVAFRDRMADPKWMPPWLKHRNPDPDG